MKKISVLIITDSYWPLLGGAEQAALALSYWLPAEVSRTVLTLAPCDHTGKSRGSKRGISALQVWHDPAGTPVVPLMPGKVARFALLAFWIWRMPGLRRICAGVIYDLLFHFFSLAYRRQVNDAVSRAHLVHCFSTSHLARCVTRACMQYHVALVHNPFVHFGRWGDSPAQIRAYSFADCLLCPTSHFKDQISPKFTQKQSVRLTVLPPMLMPAPSAQVHPLSDGAPYILFIGRDEPHKGLAQVCRVVSGISRRVRLLIVGSLVPLGYEHDRIAGLGHISEEQKQWLLHACLCLCVPSTDESFGLVYVEAMRAAKPSIGCNIAPVNTIIEHGVTGLCVEPHCDENLATALCQMIDNEKLRADMGANAFQKYSRCYQEQHTASSLLRLYEELTDKKNNGTL